MNLQQVQAALADLYPPLRTRSGHVIVTTQPSGKLDRDTLAVTVKTVFPPSNRRRTELAVTEWGGGLRVRPLAPPGISDAQRLAHLLCERSGSPGPLRLVKDEAGCSIVFELSAEEGAV